MNKQLQNRTWSVLPKEFKEEVKKMFQTINTCNGMNQSMRCILVDLFSIHNLTSDSEILSEQKPTEPRSIVGDKRLNIATQIMSSILSNHNMLNNLAHGETTIDGVVKCVVNATMIYTDALISECEEGGVK